MALRSRGSYVRARRVGEKRIFSPTQSFTRLQSSSAGRMSRPPSHPHAATSDAAPPATASFTNARLSTSYNLASRRLGVCLSVMARKSPAVPPGQHRAQRGRIHDEDQDDVGDREADEEPDDPEMPIACGLEPAEQGGEPSELSRLVDREAREHGEGAEHDHAGIGELLQGIVLALG